MVQFDLRKLFHIPTSAQRLAGLHLRPDLTKAAARMITDERSDGELRALDDCLQASESVVAVVEGRFSRRLGMLVLTTERVFFRPHGSRPSAVTSIRLADISTVEHALHSMTGQLLVRATDSIAEVDKILGTQAAFFADALRRQLIQPGAVEDQDPIAELLALRARRAAGAITDAEYEAAKRRLLDEL
jgi:hypothetical protein